MNKADKTRWQLQQMRKPEVKKETVTEYITVDKDDYCILLEEQINELKAENAKLKASMGGIYTQSIEPSWQQEYYGAFSSGAAGISSGQVHAAHQQAHLEARERERVRRQRQEQMQQRIVNNSTFGMPWGDED